MSTLEGIKKKQGGQENLNLKASLDFLFEKGGLNEHQYMDMRSDVNTKEMESALLYLRFLAEVYHCKNAEVGADILERISWSHRRLGRTEGVTTAMQPITEGFNIIKGSEMRDGASAVVKTEKLIRDGTVH